MWDDRVGRVLAVLILLFYAGDTLFLGFFSPWVLVCRVVWALSLVAYMAFIDKVPAGWRDLLTDLAALSSSVCIVGLVFETGRRESPYFVLVPVLPLSVALMYRRARRASLLAGGVGVVGMFFILRGEEPRLSLVRVSVVMAVTLFAGYLAHLMRLAQLADQQTRLERARRESLEALAVSEHRRTQAEKLALVGRLAAGVAHEINNPLAYVGSNVNFVRDELLSSGEVSREELVGVLEDTCAGLQHIQQIVGDLKGFARMNVEEPSECALADVVADALKLASLRLKHVAWLRVDVPMDLPEIFVVRQRLVQVVLNLLVNAGDALEAHRVQGSEVCVRGRNEGGRVVLSVEDNGPGFEPHVLPRLFEAFFTTKEPDKGTGLGLTLSRELVEQFGGSLTASNRPEGGACFRIEFPAHRSAEPEIPAGVSPEPVPGIAS